VKRQSLRYGLRKRVVSLNIARRPGVEILKRLETGVEIRIWHFYGVKTLSRYKSRHYFLDSKLLYASLSIFFDPERLTPLLTQMRITSTSILHGENSVKPRTS
jgi:hypothetical protein